MTRLCQEWEQPKVYQKTKQTSSQAQFEKVSRFLISHQLHFRFAPIYCRLIHERPQLKKRNEQTGSGRGLWPFVWKAPASFTFKVGVDFLKTDHQAVFISQVTAQSYFPSYSWTMFNDVMHWWSICNVTLEHNCCSLLGMVMRAQIKSSSFSSFTNCLLIADVCVLMWCTPNFFLFAEPGCLPTGDRSNTFEARALLYTEPQCKLPPGPLHSRPKPQGGWLWL